MSSPPNIISNILDIGEQTIKNTSFYETRIENDSAGNPLYVGRTPIPNGDPADTIWFITKLLYDGNVFLEHVQMPNDGLTFKYAWDQRATYFI